MKILENTLVWIIWTMTKIVIFCTAITLIVEGVIAKGEDAKPKPKPIREREFARQWAKQHGGILEARIPGFRRDNGLF